MRLDEDDDAVDGLLAEPVERAETAPWVGCGTGSRVIAYPASVAAPAIASSVRMLPKLDSVNTITPMLRNRPLRSARAALFGR